MQLSSLEKLTLQQYRGGVHLPKPYPGKNPTRVFVSVVRYDVPSSGDRIAFRTTVKVWEYLGKPSENFRKKFLAYMKSTKNYHISYIEFDRAGAFWCAYWEIRRGKPQCYNFYADFNRYYRYYPSVFATFQRASREPAGLWNMKHYKKKLGTNYFYYSTADRLSYPTLVSLREQAQHYADQSRAAARTA